MALSLRGVLHEGFDQLRGVNGTLFIGVFFLLTVALEAVLGGIREGTAVGGSGFAGLLISVSPATLSVPGPIWLLVPLSAVLVAGTLAATIVGLRVFIADERSTIPPSMYADLLPAIVSLFLAGLVVMVLVMVGSVFLVLPGLFLLVSFMFYAVRIVEGDGIVEALRSSWRLASGNRLKLFGLMLLLLVVNVGLEVAAIFLTYGLVGLFLGSVGTVYGLTTTVAAYRQLGGDG